MTNVELLQAAIESETNYNNWISSQFATIINAINNLSAKVDVAISKPNTEPQPQTMKVPSAAEYLGIAEITLRGHLKNGLIPFSQLTKGGTITIQKSDLDNYLSNTRKKSKSETEQIASDVLEGK